VYKHEEVHMVLINVPASKTRELGVNESKPIQLQIICTAHLYDSGSKDPIVSQNVGQDIKE
jgi:hypothetical protein